MRTGFRQILLVTGAILLTILLYLAPQKLKEKDKGKETGAAGISFENILTEAKSRLKREELEPIRQIEAALAKDTGNILLLDSLARRWDRVQFPIVSSHYFEQIAERNPGEKSWINAAYRYFDAFKIAADSTVRSMMADHAIRAYKKVLEINPHNLDAKTDLGLCYAEGTPNPMQGIMMLREVVAENPDHENAQFNLGVLSVRSGQKDKAIERFEKVLSLNPHRIEARFLLGRTYLETGNKQKALENLVIVKKETSDPQLINEVNSLINQINNQ